MFVRILFTICMCILAIFFFGLKIGKTYLIADIRTDLGEEFELSWAGASFVHECIRNDNDFGYSGNDEKRAYCGCVGQNLATNLTNEELAAVAFAFEQNREKGIAIPRSGTARTDSATRFATALEDGMARCRYNFG